MNCLIPPLVDPIIFFMEYVLSRFEHLCGLRISSVCNFPALVSGVVEAVEMLMEEGAGCPRLVVGMLCPALYSLMSDGLRETIDTSFGPANNSVWHVVEASARQGKHYLENVH